ncbi:hypothetical protein Kpol_1030p32 [Vanderwaltozyma polyspora DSM 70294]|uniref:C2H2-type domain-containing protein n=1 Tax=Vanderwaltozyma polyspora (strain ATCC 22028 / DSM 70294 / BCRC 21397 / CBS 2163 / NBRC 10782 / NRRL Y-8283 / UCD 57-17) TaxID=436907 RepID=A7TMV0_VANPO|nr:uncharacterized protein Kpol_1030p32 [Vanderwaltozyma polyspora DSM 70294]EDO16422.1 hypothetical protein Kpol_1030p32 [Vanderwaltozyma polyspora DSM 70294]
MGKAEFGTAAFVSKQLKARGLQKLKFYCQVCQKQCRDDNGFKSHIRSPSHLHKISTVTSEDIDKYSKQFETNFLRLLRLSHGEKKIGANKFYNEFIQDKEHIHMNATRFTSLTKFIQYLSKSGKIKVHGLEDVSDDVDTAQLLISYIDNSHETMLRNERIKQLQQTKLSDQSIRQQLLQEQIEKGKKSINEDINENAEDKVNANIEVNAKISIDIKSKMKKHEDKKKHIKKNKVIKNVFSKK